MVTDKEYVVNVTHIHPFYLDPNYVTPLNVVKDTDETVVDVVLQYDFSDPDRIRNGWFAGLVIHHLTPGNVTTPLKTWKRFITAQRAG